MQKNEIKNKKVVFLGKTLEYNFFIVTQQPLSCAFEDSEILERVADFYPKVIREKVGHFYHCGNPPIAAIIGLMTDA